MQTEYTFTTLISKTDFEITYTANLNEIGIVSIKVNGVNVGAEGEFARQIKALVLKHYEINHKQVIHLN